MSKSGAELRRAIRTDLDASPGADHLAIRRKHGVAEGIVESALTKTVAEWDAFIAETSADEPRKVQDAANSVQPAPLPLPAARNGTGAEETSKVAMPGLEQGVVKFARKPAKMGEDYIFWIPRVYIKNGLVDPHAQYDVYLKKKG